MSRGHAREPLWSLSNQRRRRLELYATYRSQMDGVMDEHGVWCGSDPPQGFREAIRHCMAYLEPPDATTGAEKGAAANARYANAILSRLEIAPCHFAPFNSVQLLLHYDVLADDVRQRLLSYTERSIPRQMDDRIRFAMYNPNFASMATAFLVLAGEMLGGRDVFDRGAALLGDLRRVLTRCGTIMEYGAPTYVPITIICLAEIADFRRDGGIVDLASRCEERVWAEVVTHFHVASGRPAGPYARAYWIDTVGHCTAMHGFLYNTFGDAVFINPVADVFPPRGVQVGHHANSSLTWPNHVWLASVDVHCPDDLAELLLAPPDEMETIYRTECIPCRIEGTRLASDGSRPVQYENPWEYAAFSGPNYTFSTADYSLGTACSQFHDGGLSESFYLTYPVSTPATRLEDTRSGIGKRVQRVRTCDARRLP